MSKLHLYKIIIGLLVVLNLFVIGSQFLFVNNPKPPNVRGAGIKEHLNFTDSQMQEFEQSKRKMLSSMREIQPKLNDLSMEYYLAKEENSTTDSLLQEINKLNALIYKVNYKHIQDVQAICDDEQIKHLEEFVKVLIGGRRPGPPKRKGPRH